VTRKPFNFVSAALAACRARDQDQATGRPIRRASLVSNSQLGQSPDEWFVFIRLLRELDVSWMLRTMLSRSMLRRGHSCMPCQTRCERRADVYSSATVVSLYVACACPCAQFTRIYEHRVWGQLAMVRRAGMPLSWEFHEPSWSTGRVLRVPRFRHGIRVAGSRLRLPSASSEALDTAEREMTADKISSIPVNEL